MDTLKREAATAIPLPMWSPPPQYAGPDMGTEAGKIFALFSHGLAQAAWISKTTGASPIISSLKSKKLKQLLPSNFAMLEPPWPLTFERGFLLSLAWPVIYVFSSNVSCLPSYSPQIFSSVARVSASTPRKPWVFPPSRYNLRRSNRCP